MADLNIKRGDIVNFDMIKPGIYGSQYKGVIVDSTAGYRTAIAVDATVDVNHANFYNYFKDKVDNVNDPTRYEYIIIQPDKTKGNLIAIGLPWIMDNTLSVISSRTANITIRNFQEFQRAPLNDFLKNLNVDFTLVITDNQ